MPKAAYDPRLLRDQETALVMEEIPAAEMVSSESKTRQWYGKSEWTKRESSRRKIGSHAWAQDEDGQLLAGDGTF